MAMLSHLLCPRYDTFKGFLVINGESKQNSSNAFVECANNGLKSFLTSLHQRISTVSQICILTYLSGSTRTDLVAN